MVRCQHSENDHFGFEFPTNGSNWTRMLTIDNDDTDANYYHPLTGNSNLDTLFIDYMMIRVDNDAGSISCSDPIRLP